MRVLVYLAGLGVCLLIAGRLTFISATFQSQEIQGDSDSFLEVTVRPTSTPVPPADVPEDAAALPLCPPKPAVKAGKPAANVLLVSTLDGQLSALDLNKNGEMFWSVFTYPGSMLSSTISQMDLDPRGQYVKLIPSLAGRLYKFNGEVVEPILMDVNSLLGSSLKMQENMVFTGGKESRTYGILADTGEILYECSMNECVNFQENSTKDVLVVQRNTQTVRAHTPRTGEQKWNFSVSLHDVSYHPSEDPCSEDTEDELVEATDDFTLKAVVPEGVICATKGGEDVEEMNLIKWKRKFQTPIVDVWRLKDGVLSKVNLFSKNHIPRKGVLLDDGDDDGYSDSPTLYIGRYNNQLYIQESVLLRMEAPPSGLHEHGQEVSFPRVNWKPYLVSPSRTPVINHGSSMPDIALISFDQTMRMGDSKTTALAINNADYPYDSGFYLYPDTTALDTEDPLTNITLQHPLITQQQEQQEEDTVQLIYMGLSHWWKEVIFISLLTAVMMNVLITRPIIHEMRDSFQARSRELVLHVQNIQAENKVKEVVREVFVEVPVPTLLTIPSTPSGTTTGSSGPDFSSYDQQGSEFSSRYISDFEPVQCLGRGGFGVVFESKNKYDDIHYAVKRITLPSSEESKKKVMREVKLHAKLDHNHIVRYYSTWLETPPLGWQEKADSWFDEADLGTGPTPFDPTSTDYSMSEREKVRKVVNPLKPYSGFSSTQSTKEGRSVDWRGDAALRTGAYGNNCDNSFSISFEHSQSEQKAYVNYSYKDDEDEEEEEGEEGGSEGEQFDVEESTGGIHFKSDYSEVKGEAESVVVDIDASGDSGGPLVQFRKSESSESLSCCDAMDWDRNQSEENSERQERRKSYLYIVMQLCKKETLRDWLRNNSVREEYTVLSLFYQICVGVQYVHKQGLIHRDLKPSNIYFSHDGTIKIGDFGLVTGTSQDKFSGPLEDGTDSSQGRGWDDQLTDRVGTQLYMSPEQLAQKPYYHKVDIFSLGLIFLELVVAFSTQMERLTALSDAKKGRYPDVISSKLEYTNLLGLMLNGRSEARPEAEQILQLSWLQVQTQVEDACARRSRVDTNSSDVISMSEFVS